MKFKDEKERQLAVQALNAKEAIIKDGIRDVSIELIELKQELSDIQDKKKLIAEEELL